MFNRKNIHKALEYYFKNERRACDQRIWLLEWPQAPLLDLTANSGTTANLKIKWTRLRNQKI